MKLRRAFSEVAPVASGLVSHFEAQGLLVEVGGSFRRRADQVGDLDIVVQANSLSDIVLPEEVFFERLGEQASHGIIGLNGDARRGHLVRYASPMGFVPLVHHRF